MRIMFDYTHVNLCYTLYYPFREIRAAFTSVRLQQPQEQRYPVLPVHAGGFRVSLIHRTLTWSLTCVRDHSYACVYIHTGVGHIDNVSALHFLTRKISDHFFLCS